MAFIWNPTGERITRSFWLPLYYTGLTDTARIHATCWKRMFDAFLETRAEAGNGAFRPFDIETDYPPYVDGKPRFDGVRDFLASRGIELPEGSPDDPPERETVCGLGNRKNEMVNRAIAELGVDAYPGSVAVLRKLRCWARRCSEASRAPRSRTSPSPAP